MSYAIYAKDEASNISSAKYNRTEPCRGFSGIKKITSGLAFVLKQI